MSLVASRVGIIIETPRPRPLHEKVVPDSKEDGNNGAPTGADALHIVHDLPEDLGAKTEQREEKEEAAAQRLQA
jgi:hypothetical protein